MADLAGLIDFLINYGGHCRDCADEDGFCPRTGIGCGQRRKAVEFILGAINYGAKHGFAAGYRLIGPGNVDDVAAAMWRDEAIDSGTPASVAAGRTREAFDEQADQLKHRWRKLSNAALRALQSQEADDKPDRRALGERE